MLLVYLCISWFLGVWVASLTAVSLTSWLISSGVSLLSAVLLNRWRQGAIVLACVGLLCLGAARYVTAVPHIDDAHIAFYNDSSTVTMTGLVVDEPDIRDRYVNLRLEAETLLLADGTEIPVEGLVPLQAFRFPVIEYGSRVRVNGRLETPPENDSFSYKEYLARQDIHSLLFLPQVEILAEGEGNQLYHAIFAFKQRAHETINQTIADPQASLLAGILLGNDNGLPPDLDEDFQITGMTHIIAISGFNIAILIMILVAVGQPFLGQRGSVAFAMVGIIVYTILVGADASVVRAAIMGSIYLISSRWLGRPSFSVATLLFSGFVMTAIRPFTLWDVGFQLSFAATLSLILYADPLTRRVRRWLLHLFDRRVTQKLMGVLTEAVIITLVAQFLTLPLIVGHFGQLSLVSLVANALILPAQPGVMLWGGLATLTGLILPLLGQLFGWIAWLFLSYTIWLVRVLAAVPGASLSVELSWTGVVVIYALIAAATWLAKQEKKKRAKILAQAQKNMTQKVAFSGSLIGALLLFSWGGSQPDGKLHIVFMDVGQGDATFIQTPSGRQILIDGGLYPSVLNDRLGRQMPFWDKELDMMIATHPDADHVAGLVGVFERYQVDRLITDGSEVGESQIYDAVLEAAALDETAVHTAVAGETIIIEDGVTLEILHPTNTFHSDNRNDNSVSIRLVYGNFTCLITGDAEEQAERQMLQRDQPLNALVYKAGHHGSRTSSTMPFLEAIRPLIIIVSAGKENRFGHPHPEMLERAAAINSTVLRTDELGTIEVTTDGKTLWWKAGP